MTPLPARWRRARTTVEPILHSDVPVYADDDDLDWEWNQWASALDEEFELECGIENPETCEACE